MRIVVALGANLGDPFATVRRALLELERIGELLKTSALYETEPLLHPDTPTLGQSNFVNAVALLETELAPEEVMEALLQLECELGRDRSKETVRWAPRVIDLDLIAADNLICSSEFLRLPHPEMHKRSFVLEPMAEVWPEWVHPIFHQDVPTMLEKLGPS